MDICTRIRYCLGRWQTSPLMLICSLSLCHLKRTLTKAEEILLGRKLLCSFDQYVGTRKGIKQQVVKEEHLQVSVSSDWTSTQDYTNLYCPTQQMTLIMKPWFTDKKSTKKFWEFQVQIWSRSNAQELKKKVFQMSLSKFPKSFKLTLKIIECIYLRQKSTDERKNYFKHPI